MWFLIPQKSWSSSTHVIHKKTFDIGTFKFGQALYFHVYSHLSKIDN